MKRENPIGYLESFDADRIAAVVEDYVNADEVERALWILDNLPGKYRDFPPTQLKHLKESILQAMVTPHAYMASGLDCNAYAEVDASNLLFYFLRAILVRLEVERYNAKGVTPHIIDVGPGEYFIPLGLKHLGAKFTYCDVGMDPKPALDARPRIKEHLRLRPDPGQPVIFLALEIIEHVAQPKELVVEALRYAGKMPERIHLSTPCYTFDGRKKDWRKSCGLPHLRTYTPKEFLQVVDSLFPGYALELYYADILSIRGVRTDDMDERLASQEQLAKIMADGPPVIE